MRGQTGVQVERSGSACVHFDQRELGKENNWRSYSTKKAYRVYLKRWIIPRWGTISLSDVRPIVVASWLRQLPLAKSSCAKIRNLFSVVFNHACRYEFFDGNPITFVRHVKTALIDEKGCKKGTKTCPFAPSLVSAKSKQLF